ncbi:hypothetical protein SDC9_191795 [bioreactor metagenome]|uniref:Uncharacterized protein n=1 Tax=bioreactor metagenome TaxID=1076179 RepID=A0A645I752_9ZZZZ
MPSASGFPSCIDSGLTESTSSRSPASVRRYHVTLSPDAWNMFHPKSWPQYTGRFRGSSEDIDDREASMASALNSSGSASPRKSIPDTERGSSSRAAARISAMLIGSANLWMFELISALIDCVSPITPASVHIE